MISVLITFVAAWRASRYPRHRQSSPYPNSSLCFGMFDRPTEEYSEVFRGYTRHFRLDVSQHGNTHGDDLGQPRNELKRRGLICGGVKDLQLRFLEDDAFGVIGGNLATLSDEKLKKICESRAIPSRGDRQELVHKVQAYHRQKRAEQSKAVRMKISPILHGQISYSPTSSKQGHFTRCAAEYTTQHGHDHIWR